MLFAFSVGACLAVQAYRRLYRRRFPVHSSGIVLITDAVSRIGNHAAIALAKEGYHVYAGVRTEKEMLHIQSRGIPTLKPLFLDVTKRGSCISAVQLIEKVLKQTGLPLVALVNTARVMTTSPLEHHTIADAQKAFNTNFFGVLVLTQLALPSLKQSNGRVINISSLAGRAGTPLQGVFAASMAALESMSDSLRREVQAFRIAVSVVEPAYIAKEKAVDISGHSRSKRSVVRTLSRQHSSFFVEKSSPLDLFRWAVHRVVLENAKKKTIRRLEEIMAAANYYEPEPKSGAIHSGGKPNLHRQISKPQEAEASLARSEYSHLYTKRVQSDIQRCISSAETSACTTRAIKDAVSSPYPQTRYPVSNVAGVPSWLLVYVLALLPDRFIDARIHPIHT